MLPARGWVLRHLVVEGLRAVEVLVEVLVCVRGRHVAEAHVEALDWVPAHHVVGDLQLHPLS